MEAELILAVKKASEAFALISNKAICGLSTRFNVVKAVKNRKTKTRIITEIDLLEISLVTFPANKESQVMTIKSI
ncbi:MAG: HK97 family phage prohead protease [Alphaproteobacteria bacterium]|nr:HK97 family phage prohead protease [Alphaproteobacteria bacterium]